MSVLARLWLAFCVVMIAASWPSPASAGPPPIDPKQMSGMSRPDPEVAAGAVSVRVLLGSFDKPALDHEVTLQVANADGSAIETRTEKTGNQGRVTFEGLDDFIGGQAVAEVVLDGKTMRSQPIELRPEMGSRVMLVQGAKGSPMDAPLPGIAFEFDKSPPGSVMVGTFHLGERRPQPGVEVTLTITPPQDGAKDGANDGKAEVVEKKATSDAEGKVVFEGLLPPEVADGSLFSVSAKLTDDGPVKRSNTFRLPAGKGMAVVLAEGRMPAAASAPGADPHQPQGVRRLPGPRTVPSMPQGAVRIRVVDGRDQPVADQPVAVIKKSASGNDVEFPGTTGKDGVALVEGVAVESDSFYLVGVTYAGAPYSSGFFQLDKAGGIAVDVRVWEVTGDPSVVKSALQYEVDGSENDLARVIQLYEVMVTGDKAFWPPGGMRIDAQSGAKGLTVLRVAEAWLEHEEKADFVTLARPLPPGELVNLSIGYMLEHDGELTIDFVPPFATVQTAAAVPRELTLEAPGARPSDRETNNPDLVLYEIGARAFGSPVEITISGLPIRNPIYRRLALWLGVLMGVALVIGIARRPRAGTQARLAQRRTELLDLLCSEPEPGPRRDRIVMALDRIYRQLEALEKRPSARAGAPRG